MDGTSFSIFLVLHHFSSLSAPPLSLSCPSHLSSPTSRQLIYNYPEQLFSDAGVMAIEHADFEGIEQLALVLGGEIVSTFGNPEKVKLGSCKLIEEIMIGEDKVSELLGLCGEESEVQPFLEGSFYAYSLCIQLFS